MKGFEKLLDIVRKNNPELISEQTAQEMLADYNSYETQLQDDAFDKGKSAGFEEGYREGIEKQKAVCKEEMDKLLEKCDVEATDKLETIVKTLNENHAEKLQEVYDLCCKTMIPASEVEAMDKDHAEKFAQAMEAIDNVHAKKLNYVYESVKKSIDEDHSKKLQKVANSYKSMLTESANKCNSLKKALKEEKERKIELLTESVDKYLNYALQSRIPTKQLVSEAKYNASQKALEKITSILKINNILQESKDGIFQDYEAKLKDAKDEQNKLMVENAALKDSLNKKEAKLLLESKIAKCTPAEAAFLRSYFENAKSTRVIEEQIEDARSAYSRLHAERRAELVNSVKKSSPTPSKLVTESKTSTAPVKKEEPSKKVVTESANVNSVSINGKNGINPFLTAYSKMLKKS